MSTATGIQISNMICEVKSLTEALIAQQAGVGALLVMLERTPATSSQHGCSSLKNIERCWNVNYQLLHEVKNQFPNTPIIARIRKGHSVEGLYLQKDEHRLGRSISGVINSLFD